MCMSSKYIKKRKSTVGPISRESVERWIEFSMNPRTEEEIREQILTDPSHVCYSYICMKSSLSEEFIDELKILSTELLDKETYIPENIKLVSSILDIKNSAERTVFVRNLKNNKNVDQRIRDKIAKNSVVRDKLDWRNIVKYQNISPNFCKKHFVEIDEMRRMYTTSRD